MERLSPEHTATTGEPKSSPLAQTGPPSQRDRQPNLHTHLRTQALARAPRPRMRHTSPARPQVRTSKGKGCCLQPIARGWYPVPCPQAAPGTRAPARGERDRPAAPRTQERSTREGDRKLLQEEGEKEEEPPKGGSCAECATASTAQLPRCFHAQLARALSPLTNFLTSPTTTPTTTVTTTTPTC